MLGTHLDLPVQGSAPWHREIDSKSTFCLVDVSEFRILVGPHGKKTLVFPSEAELVQMAQAARAKLKVPPIQRMLKQACKLQAKLNRSPDLTRDALAKSIGISPPYLTRLLNLLNLAPEIQEYIDALPPSKTKGKITESRLKRVARIEDLEVQKKVFQEAFGVDPTDSLPRKTFAQVDFTAKKLLTNPPHPI